MKRNSGDNATPHYSGETKTEVKLEPAENLLRSTGDFKISDDMKVVLRYASTDDSTLHPVPESPSSDCAASSNCAAKDDTKSDPTEG